MTASGDGSSRSSWRTPRRSQGARRSRPRIDFRGRRQRHHLPPPQRLPMEQVASSGLATTARSTAGSSGARTASSSGSGPPLVGSATTSGRSTGAGGAADRRPVGQGPVRRGQGGEKPHRPGQTGHQEERVAGRGRRRPLGVVVAGANGRTSSCSMRTIEAVVAERPDPKLVEQHLCLDAGHDNAPSREVVERHGYVEAHPAGPRGAPPERRAGRRKARRWVVERTLAWLSKCRGLLVRYDKHGENYLGLIQLACGLLWYRRLYRLRAA